LTAAGVDRQEAAATGARARSGGKAGDVSAAREERVRTHSPDARVSPRETARRRRGHAVSRQLPPDRESPLERVAGLVTATPTLGALLAVLILVMLLL
jgi:hypothetical protein